MSSQIDIDKVEELQIEHTHHEPLDRAEADRVRRRIDFRLMPLLCVLLVLAFLDRINIGNARIQGLEKDLDMKGQDFSIALFMFFIPYILFEIPCNMLMRKIRPSLWLPGIVTVCQGLTRSFAGLVVCRALIGALEAGFFPGCIYLISMYYTRKELQARITLFFSSGLLAGAFSGLLSFGIAHMSGISGYGGWRWIFILEGLATVVIAAICGYFLPDWPHQSSFLGNQDRDILLRDLQEDSAHHVDKQSTKEALGIVLRDPKVYLCFIMYFGGTVTAYSTSYFVPTILVQLGWVSYKAQYMSIPIYLVAFVIAVSVGIISDRLRHRFAFIAAFWSITSIGYIVLIAQQHVSIGAQYMAIYLVVFGNFSAQPIVLVWLNNNIFGHRRRGLSIALSVSLANTGGIVASNVFLESQSPRFPAGYGTALGTCLLSISAAVVMFFYLRHQNAVLANRNAAVTAGSDGVEQTAIRRVKYML